MLNLIQYTLNSLIPHSSLTHLECYFYLSKAISIHKNAKIRRIFTLALSIILYQAVHVVYLFLFPSETHLDRFRQADILSLLISIPLYNGLNFLIALQVVYNLYTFYFNCNQKVNFLLENILVRGRTTFFLSNNKNLVFSIQTLYRKMAAYLYQFSLVIGKLKTFFIFFCLILYYFQIYC